MALNPVERRLVDLCGYWETFRTDPLKRLLIWQVPDNAQRMLQCFYEVQKHDTEYTTGDLFIVFDAPFENSIQYSRALKEALAGQYEASREELEQQGISPDWQYEPKRYPDSATGFVRTLRSFGSQHHTAIGYLVAVLMPTSVTDDEAFASWLTRSIDAGIPERLRFSVIDSIENPRFTPLVDARPDVVLVDTPNIDALTTAQETFAQEGAAGPAGVFRNYLMGLMTLVEKGSAKQIMTKAKDALAFARKHQWLDQEVVITSLVAGALLKEKRCDEAVVYYQHARKVATQASEAEHPAGSDMVLQSWFGEAGAHLADAEDAKAADCYDEAAIVAQQIPNHILAIEAFRMSAYCHARLQNIDAAIERGSLALAIGEKKLELEARLMTTLPIAAMDLLRVTDPERAALIEEIRQRQEAQMNKAREDAEEQALQLEQAKDPAQLNSLEEQLTRNMAAAEQHAAEQLSRVAASGDEPFFKTFTQARQLLSDQWPLAIASAIPLKPQAKRGAAA